MDDQRKVLLIMIVKLLGTLKKNPFASASDTIRKSELDIAENTVMQCLDDAGLYGYHAANKEHSYWQRFEKHVWSSQRLTEIGRQNSGEENSGEDIIVG